MNSLRHCQSRRKTRPFLEKNADSGKTQPFGYFSTQRGYRVPDKALCSHRKHCSEGAFDLSTADLPSATSAAAAAAASISAAAEAAAAAASFASSFSGRSAHVVVRRPADETGERELPCGDGASLVCRRLQEPRVACRKPCRAGAAADGVLSSPAACWRASRNMQLGARHAPRLLQHASAGSNAALSRALAAAIPNWTL